MHLGPSATGVSSLVFSSITTPPLTPNGSLVLAIGSAPVSHSTSLSLYFAIWVFFFEFVCCGIYWVSQSCWNFLGFQTEEFFEFVTIDKRLQHGIFFFSFLITLQSTRARKLQQITWQVPQGGQIDPRPHRLEHWSYASWCYNKRIQ